MKINSGFVKVKGICFTILLDKRIKHNFISPAFLAFFNIGEEQEYSLLNNDIGEVSAKPEYNYLFPFITNYVTNICFENIFHYVGKKVVWCAVSIR